MKMHECSRSHLYNHMELQLYGRVRISEQLYQGHWFGFSRLILIKERNKCLNSLFFDTVFLSKKEMLIDYCTYISFTVAKWVMQVNREATL